MIEQNKRLVPPRKQGVRHMSNDDAFESERSKSQRKREATALQDLGEALIKLDAAQLARMPVPDAVREAVEAARRIQSRSAARRQRQYIGKLMRGIDPDVVAAALDALRGQTTADAARFHQVERWRDRLIEGGDAALGELLQAYPGADKGHVRRLVRGAMRERDTGGAPISFRALFRYLRSILIPG